LFEQQESVLVVAHHQRRRRGDAVATQRGQPLHGLLKQARLAVEREELLGKAAARQRPQPRATAARHDHWLEFDSHRLGCMSVVL
jgi:hypothetical protein